MKVLQLEDRYLIQDFDKGHFVNDTRYLKNIANIIDIFKMDNFVNFPITEERFYFLDNAKFIKYRYLYTNQYCIYLSPFTDNHKGENKILFFKLYITGIAEIL